MRIAQCIRPLKLELKGNKAGVGITEGWQGDLDQVIGVDDNGISTTVLDALGHHYNADNFRFVTAERRPVDTTVTKPRIQE